MIFKSLPKYYLCKASVQCHSRMIGILCKIQVRGSPQLLLDDKCLFKQLKSSGQELVLDL